MEKSARSPAISGHRSKRRPGARLTSRKQPLPQSRVDASRQRGKIESSVLGAVGSYLFPSRTQQSSPPAPKILGTSVPGKIGQGRDLKTPTRKRRGLLFSERGPSADGSVEGPSARSCARTDRPRSDSPPRRDRCRNGRGATVHPRRGGAARVRRVPRARTEQSHRLPARRAETRVP